MSPDIEQTIRNYLPQVKHMSLATCAGNQPWVCEVHFAYDRDLNLYFRSLTTRRHSQELAENPQVAGNIVAQHPLHAAVMGIYFEGFAHLLTDGEEIEIAREAASRILHIADEALDQYKDPNGHQFYKIEVDSYYVFGNLGGLGGQKYSLPWRARR